MVFQLTTLVVSKTWKVVILTRLSDSHMTSRVVRMTMTASSGNQFDYFGCQADLTVYNGDVALE